MATAANWIANFIVVISGSPLFSTSKWRTYVIFIVTNFVTVPIIYYFYPETGSRSLEEVDVIFRATGNSGKPWLSVVKAAQEEPRWFDKNGEPTDSYGGSSEKSDYDPAKGRSSSENPEPERSQSRPSLSQDLVLRPSNESWETHGPAPSPAVSRMHS